MFLCMPLQKYEREHSLVSPIMKTRGGILLCRPLKTRQGEDIFSCMHLEIIQVKNCFILNFSPVFQVCKEIISKVLFFFVQLFFLMSVCEKYRLKWVSARGHILFVLLFALIVCHSTNIRLSFLS